MIQSCQAREFILECDVGVASKVTVEAVDDQDVLHRPKKAHLLHQVPPESLQPGCAQTLT